ncbi:MAG: hypothetical protein ACRD3F_15230 [Acidobacteriaceae bacterium]
MSRLGGIRKAAIPKLPDKVRWATSVPLLVIPSAGHNGAMDGTAGAGSRRTGSYDKREKAVTLRYLPCCDEHKAQIKVESLVTLPQLQGLCNRLTQHMGHGALQPDRARVEWAKCEEKVACADCLEAAVEKTP